MITGSGPDAAITSEASAQAPNPGGPGAIGSGRDPAGALSSDTRRRHATLRIVLGSLPAAAVAFVVGVAVMASPPALAFVVEAATTAGLEILGRVLPVLVAFLPPFPLAVVGAVALLCAVATWPPHSPHLPAPREPRCKSFRLTRTN